MKYEILQNSKNIKEHIRASLLNEFIYLDGMPIDMDYFLKHAKLNTVGMHFSDGPFSLGPNGVIEKITSSEYVDGYDLGGAFYLEKKLLLTYLDSGQLPLDAISGIPVISSPEKNKRPALFLDRDGVINIDKNYVCRPEQLTFYDDLIPIIKYANEKKWLVIVLTNQSGIGRGMFNPDDVKNLHSYMDLELKKKGVSIDEWFFCPYHQQYGIGQYKKFSFMRKPFPGMALKACEKYAIDLDKSFMIGDKVTDELFLPGVKSIHINRGSDLSEAKAPIYKSYAEILSYMKSVM